MGGVQRKGYAKGWTYETARGLDESVGLAGRKADGDLEVGGLARSERLGFDYKMNECE